MTKKSSYKVSSYVKKLEAHFEKTLKDDEFQSVNAKFTVEIPQSSAFSEAT